MISEKLSNVEINRATYWAGSQCPIPQAYSSEAILEPLTLYRESPILHGKFLSVNLMESNLGHLAHWPLIVDQAIRLLTFGRVCDLTVRFTESQHITIFQFANFLNARQDIRIAEFEQTLTSDRVFIYRLKLQRQGNRPSFTTFDFGIITDGSRNDNVLKFISSIEAALAGHEIDVRVFVCGPFDALPEFGDRAFQIVALDGETKFDNKGWITKKKNLIVQASAAENILIVHDRYILSPEFFDQMIEYGSDFGVVVPFQHTSKGKRFPDWVTLSSRWTWTPSHLMARDDFNQNMYVNGGAILAKRALLVEHSWNELLFWSQGEDVELTRRMQQAGIVPAYADTVQLEVIEFRDGYISSFEKGPTTQDSDVLPGFFAGILGHRVVGVILRSPVGARIINSKFVKTLQSTNFGAWLGRRLMVHVQK